MRIFLMGVLMTFPAMAPLAMSQNGAANQDLLTKAYEVPPTFLMVPVPARDPFAPPREVRKRTAKLILEQAGVTFGPGAAAIYNPETSQVIVRNDPDQLELVEAYLNAIRSQLEQRIQLRFRFAVLDDLTAREEFVDELSIGGVVCRPAPTRFTPPESFLEEMAGESRPDPEVRYEIRGPFDGKKAQEVFESLLQMESVSLSPPVEEFSSPSHWIVLESGKKKLGAHPMLGGEGFTIDVHTFLPSTARPFETDIVKGYPLPDTFSETIRNGHTFAITKEVPGESFEVFFVSATLVGPHGNPLKKGPIRRHVAVDGETFADIADAYGVEEAELLVINRVQKEQPAAGDLLMIPVAALPDPAKPNPEVERALKKITLPEINFADTPLSEAIEFLHRESLRVTEETDVKIPPFVIRGIVNPTEKPITLRLINVPLSEALRYTASLARGKFVVEGETVVIIPLGSE